MDLEKIILLEFRYYCCSCILCFTTKKQPSFQSLNEKNKICSYFNFSGAERKAIDLACLFTFSDLRRMQGGVSYNIAIYDELFDSSIDIKATEEYKFCETFGNENSNGNALAFICGWFNRGTS